MSNYIKFKELGKEIEYKNNYSPLKSNSYEHRISPNYMITLSNIMPPASLQTFLNRIKSKNRILELERVNNLRLIMLPILNQIKMYNINKQNGQYSN